VNRVQLHTPIPKGYISLSFENKNDTSDAAFASSNLLQQPQVIGFDASPNEMEQVLEKLSGDELFTVQVTRNYGSQYQSNVWTITFITPRGDIPSLVVDASMLTPASVAAGVNATVVTRQNGSESTLWFNPIPAWFTEVPLSWATGNSVTTNVEVYVTSPSTSTVAGATGDVMKAVCDASGQLDVTGFAGWAKGNESSCAFYYSSNATAAIYNQSVTYLGENDTSLIEIRGSGFFKASSSAGITVTIAGEICNVTLANDTSINCVIESVPWGSHQVQVYIPGHGYALHLSEDLLVFDMTVYSVSSLTGSFAGGQILTVKGRGFRPNTTITLEGVGPCINTNSESTSSTLIQCRVPAISRELLDFDTSLISTYMRFLTDLNTTTSSVNGTTALTDFNTTSSVNGTTALIDFNTTNSVNGTTALTDFNTTSTVNGTTALTDFNTASSVNGTTALTDFNTTSNVNGTTALTNVNTTSSVNSTTITGLSIDVPLYIDGVSLNESYRYSLDGTPFVSSIDPTVISTAVTTDVTIFGMRLRGNESTTTVSIGATTCVVLNGTD
jgi:hypothetical protein